jgi:hypothetical protein
VVTPTAIDIKMAFRSIVIGSHWLSVEPRGSLLGMECRFLNGSLRECNEKREAKIRGRGSASSYAFRGAFCLKYHRGSIP